MFSKKLKFEVVEGVTEGVSFSGARKRRRTVLLRVGQFSISKKAFQLGVILALFQVLDAFLTYMGVKLLGVHMEGNAFLHELMVAYGLAPTLFATKVLALLLVIILTAYAHTRYWIRPIIVVIAVAYLFLAVVPWTYIISQLHAR